VPSFNTFLQRPEAPVVLTFVIVFVGLSFASEYFLTVNNLLNVARQSSVLAIVALGAALVIISGNIDLSIGSVVGLTAVVAALIANATGSPLIGMMAGLLVGFTVGATNAFLVNVVQINSFIATLGMLSIVRGAALLLTGGIPEPFSNWAAFLGSGRIYGLPVSVGMMIVLAAVFHLFITRLRWGRNIFAVGDNAEAAHLAGIAVARVRAMTFIIGGLMASTGGLVLAGILRTANPNLGRGYELDVIAAVILGGAALSGGRGSIIGVVIGAILMGVIKNGFVLLQISGYWQVVTIGFVVIAAVALERVPWAGRKAKSQPNPRLKTGGNQNALID
jgi:ribose transport system permease protein